MLSYLESWTDPVTGERSDASHGLTDDDDDDDDDDDWDHEEQFTDDEDEDVCPGGLFESISIITFRELPPPALKPPRTPWAIAAPPPLAAAQRGAAGAVVPRTPRDDDDADTVAVVQRPRSPLDFDELGDPTTGREWMAGAASWPEAAEVTPTEVDCVVGAPAVGGAGAGRAAAPPAQFAD